MFDMELYGGRRAYIAHLRACASYAMGAYHTAQIIDWAGVERLVFVCQGNICRSPYASARARVFGARAISLGMAANDGAGANAIAAQNALPRGIDLTDHRSARLQESLILPGDLIVVFEPAQKRKLMHESITRARGVTLLGLWAHPIRPHIQDPYGRSNRYFQQCFAVIDLNIQELVNRLMSYGAPAVAGSASDRLSVHSVP